MMPPFFWFWKPPTTDVPLIDWIPFRSATWAMLALVVAVAVVLLVVLYRWRIGKFEIRRPTDPFRVPSRAWWLGWLVWALAPAAAAGILYWNSFQSRFAVGFPPFWGAVTSGLAAWAAVLVLFQLLIWLPGITPAKFLYHPRWPWRLRRPARRRAAVIPAGASAR